MTADVEHRQGCPATRGYGHGVEPCICGAVTEVELLPLPEWTGRYKVPTEPMSGEGEMLDDLLHRYGHAVAEHNIAARDAEIEWLRMDVKEWKISHAVLTDTCHHLRARADRLEETLRMMEALLDEVRSHFTRDDDLPDDLLPRIDAALAGKQGGVK